MKTPFSIWFFAILLTVNCLQAQPASKPQAEAGDKQARPAAEDFGCDVFEGKTNKIVRIAKVDPRFVWVVYEGGTAGRKIPRAELPPQLKAKFPYDANKASEALKDKAQETQTQLALQKQGLRIRESNLQAQIDALKKQRLENEREISNLDRQINAAPNTRTARIAKGQKLRIIREQDDLRKRVDNLDATLKQIRAQIDTLP